MVQKANQVTYNPQIASSSGMIPIAVKQAKGIQDPYSGKYYGESPYETLVINANQARAQIQQQMQEAQRNMLSSASLALPYNPQGVLLGAIGAQPQQTLGQYFSNQLASIFIPNKEDYVQFDKVNLSYQAYGDDWDKFFQGNYQNPRLAEEQANKQARDQQKLSQRTNQAQAIQAISEGTDTASSRKTMGTGVGTSTFNPFATLEAGLGL